MVWRLFEWREIRVGVERRSPGTIDGKARISKAMEMTMEMKALNKRMKMQWTTREHYSVEPPNRALLMEDLQKMDGQERRAAVRHLPGGNHQSLENAPGGSDGHRPAAEP